ncbi:MAG: hypothetical protein ACRDV1_01735 [Actinomycetes bacterium]
MTTDGRDGELLDTLLVACDAQLLDTLAARQELRATDDEVALAFAALAADVDEGLSQLLQGPAPEPDLVDDRLAEVLPLRPGSGRTVRIVAAAVAVAGILSVSGVAAAVSGDPLAPYRSVVSAVRGGDDLQGNAAPVARAHKRLAGVRARIAHGDLAEAADRLAEVRSSLGELSPGDRRSVEKRLAALEAKLARAATEKATQSGPTAKTDKAGKPAKGDSAAGPSPDEAAQTESKPSAGPAGKSAQPPGPDPATHGRDKPSSAGHGSGNGQAQPDAKNGAVGR